MKKTALFFILVMVFAVGGTAYGKGYMLTDDLWVRAVINTVDGPVDGVLYKGGENKTERGDTVIWGYVYASPSDVSWGSEDNPDLYIKVWFDVSGRIDVNFFHVSVPSIDVYTDYPYNGSYDKRGTTTTDSRYVRHEYQLQDSTADTCENISGNWSESATVKITVNVEGNTETSNESVSRSISIEQNNCNVDLDYLVGSSHFTRSGNVEGKTVHLSGECLDTDTYSSSMNVLLKAYGCSGFNLTTSTGNGEGTIFGDKITYKGSCNITGTTSYLGTTLTVSTSISEDSTMTRSSSRSRTPDVDGEAALSPTDAAVDLLMKALKEKVDEMNK